MTINKLFKPHVLLAVLGVSLSMAEATAQVDPINERRWNVSEGNYATPASWDPANFAPPEARYGEWAAIANGGIANVIGFVPSSVPGEGNIEATPGELRVTNGRLNIQSAGQLRVVPGDAGAAGIALVSAGGTLSVTQGGVFESESLSLAGTLALGITGPGFTPLEVANTATLGGSLAIDFGGFAPTPAQSWSLIEAGTFVGNFANVSATGVTLSPTQSLQLRQIPAGGGQMTLELFIDQALTLQVDRESGQVSMFSTGPAVTIDSYRIFSAAGVLDSSDVAYNRLGEQLPSSTWRASNLSANQIAELQQVGSTLVDSSGFSFGNVYAPPAPTGFRQGLSTAQDLVFEYSAPDGVVRQGVVEYIGTAVNDLLITIDPSDGRVQLSNPSGFDVAIDAYSLSSASGSLIPANWNSLDDRDGPGNNDGGWRESNPSPNFLAELYQDGEQMMLNGSRFLLGNIFDFAAGEPARDIVFEFQLAGTSETLMGTVVYDTIVDSSANLGDFNGDGIVDAADYTVWRDNLGRPASTIGNNGAGGATVTAADYQVWRANFGATYASGSLSTTAAAVPEPPAVGMAVAAIALAIAGLRRLTQ